MTNRPNRRHSSPWRTLTLGLLVCCLALLVPTSAGRSQDGDNGDGGAADGDAGGNDPGVRTLKGEPLDLWVQDEVIRQLRRGNSRGSANGVRVSVWFDRQLLGDGGAYKRRAAEFARPRANWTRSTLRTAAVAALKQMADASYEAARPALDRMVRTNKLTSLERHWVINGISGVLPDIDALDQLKSVPGVRKIFLARPLRPAGRQRPNRDPFKLPEVERAEFDPAVYEHPWYTHYLMAVKTWKRLGVTGAGTLNVIHDGNFVFSPQLLANLYRSPGETLNGRDDDGNGLVDDIHGYNFDRGSNRLTTMAAQGNRLTHGDNCAAVICAPGVEGKPVEFGIAPEARWAGVIGGSRIESAIEWAIEHHADTYSMSFSIPGLGDARSHWRKVMEHASLCGVYFVSGAGNFAQQVEVPVQMRTPEDIPEVVFAAAGIQRDFSRTPFSSQGPVLWETEHYRDGEVQKPEVCAFNFQLPSLAMNGDVSPRTISGNSFAGPMFCGAISLMLSADPELLPWDLKEIIQSTATDVAAEGVDPQTGHGLINCYRAVKEVLRRRAIREGADPSPYEGREEGDEVTAEQVRRALNQRLEVTAIQPDGRAERKGVQAGDVILMVAGQKVTDERSMAAAINGARDAGEFELVVGRGTEEHTFTFRGSPIGLSAKLMRDQPDHW